MGLSATSTPEDFRDSEARREDDDEEEWKSSLMKEDRRECFMRSY